MAALGGMALSAPFMFVFICLCLTAFAGACVLFMVSRHRRRLEYTGAAIGSFMRGEWAARANPAAHDDACSRLQHRMNNLLDTLDLHLRGDGAALDLARHADYAEKLRQSPLAVALAGDSTKTPRPKESMGDFLQQLGDNMAEMLAAKPPPTETDSTAIIALAERQRAALCAMEQAAARLNAMTAQLARRATQPSATPPQETSASAMLEQALGRMLELATVMALNIAIEAGRAPAGSGLHSAAEDMRSLVSQLHKARSHAAAAQPPASREESVASVPLSSAVEALTQAQQLLEEQRAAAQAIADTLETLAGQSTQNPLLLAEAA